MFDSVEEALAYHAGQHPDKLCIADEMEAFTYGEVWRKVQRVADTLERLQVKKGEKIAVECSQNADFLICVLACHLLGVIFVPLENQASSERVEDIISSTKSKYFISNGNYKVECECLNWEALQEESAERKKRTTFQSADTIAEILYTTGTTGKAKGIVLTNRNNVAVAENIIYGTEMKKDNVELVPLPLSHSHALRTCYANLVNGSSVVLATGVMRVKKIFELIEKYHVTAYDLSPSAANVLMKLAKRRLKEYSEQVDYIEIGSAILEESLKRELCEVFQNSRLYNFYGSTEAGRSCIVDFNKEREREGCIGKPAKNAEFIVTDEDRNVIQSSKENLGLLAVSGLMNMQEYFQAPELTEQIMQQGYIYTNDLGYIDEDGYIYILGRMDDIINYNGIKIAPEEIESCVQKYSGVVDCACVPLKDELCGQVPKVFVEVANKETFDTTILLKFMAENLEANKMPKKIEVIDKIPRASNGKLLRKKLREEL